MKTLEEIKLLFEHRSYAVRSDFINEYHFDDDYSDYYRQFVISEADVNNHLYLSDLIDLAGWFGFYDKRLRERWFSYLFTNRHYIVKLAVLDYFKFCDKDLLDQSYEEKLRMLLRTKMFSILRNQVLVNLMVLRTSMYNHYIADLEKSLANTNDWRSIYRTLKNTREADIRKTDKQRIVSCIRRLSEKKDFGEGTQKLLGELEAQPD